MSSRLLLSYLIVLHVAVLALAIWLLRERPLWLLAIEGLLLLSIILGLAIWRRQRSSRRILADGTAALRDQDYSLRLREVGVADVDELIRVYNQLLERIRSERLDNQRQQFFLSLLIESTALGIITMDFDGNIQRINSWGRRQLDISPGAVLPQGLLEIDHPLATKLVELGEEEQRLVRLDDNQRYRCESAYFIDRGFRRRFIVINNLSGELTDAEVAAYGQVIRMMAHEVNNTTAATRSLLQSLIDTDDLGDEEFRELAREYLPYLEERGELLNEFMRRFADVVRLPEPKLATVQLQQALETAARLSEEVCRLHNITLQLSLKPATVQADEALLQQVITNAITNARESILESGQPNGIIELTCAGKSFAIADNGAGIDDAAREKLFTPFFSTKPTGQGIGLTLTRDVLERHGASYSLSTGEDGWTRLRVSFAS